MFNPLSNTPHNDSAIVVQVTFPEETICLRQIDEIKRLKEELKKHNETVSSILENDATLSELSDRAEERVQAVKQLKGELMHSLEVANAKIKAKECREEIKELKES